MIISLYQVRPIKAATESYAPFHLVNLAELFERPVQVAVGGPEVEAEDPDAVGRLRLLPVPSHTGRPGGAGPTDGRPRSRRSSASPSPFTFQVAHLYPDPLLLLLALEYLSGLDLLLLLLDLVLLLLLLLDLLLLLSRDTEREAERDGEGILAPKKP